jgi:hypothetical protein
MRFAAIRVSPTCWTASALLGRPQGHIKFNAREKAIDDDILIPALGSESSL